MTRPSLPTLVALSLVLSACVTQPQVPSSQRSGQLDLTLASGDYNCELGQHIQVERDIRDQVNYRVRIAWKGATYRLERDHSYSGLPRFEDSASGLVWIDLPWKSMLLDGRSNKPLANECRSA